MTKHSRTTASAILLLLIIGYCIVSFWQAGAIGDWAIFLYGLG